MRGCLESGQGYDDEGTLAALQYYCYDVYNYDYKSYGNGVGDYSGGFEAAAAAAAKVCNGVRLEVCTERLDTLVRGQLIGL